MSMAFAVSLEKCITYIRYAIFRVIQGAANDVPVVRFTPCGDHAAICSVASPPKQEISGLRKKFSTGPSLV